MKRATIPRLAAAVLSGGVLACAFPLPPRVAGLESPSAAWLAFVPLIILACRTPPRRSFWWGWFSGLVFWAISLVWLLQLRLTWGYLSVVILAWAGLAAYCALYTAVFTWCLSSVSAALRRDGPTNSPKAAPGHRELLLLVVAPVAWVGLEYLRSTVLTGFPWNALGISQSQNLAVVQLAQFGGVYTVSALLMLVNAGLALTAVSVVHGARVAAYRRRFHPELMVALAACALAWMWGVRTVRHLERSAADALQVAIVQPTIAQLRKWDDAGVDSTYEALYAHSCLALVGRPDLLIWPETAIPEAYEDADIGRAIAYRLVTNGVPLLLGTMEVEASSDDELPKLYNSALLVGTNGLVEGTYRKRHLVPFGEYLPFAHHIKLIQRLAPLGFTCVPGDRATVFEAAPRDRRAQAVVPFAVVICFEDTIAGLARDSVRNGARLLVNLTNDAWFDGSSAAMQHMAHAVFRAVENRVPVVRCTNTGLSCFISHLGRIAPALWDAPSCQPMAGFAASRVDVPLTAGKTPYARCGDWLFAIPCTALLGVLFVLVLFREKRDDTRPAGNAGTSTDLAGSDT